MKKMLGIAFWKGHLTKQFVELTPFAQTTEGRIHSAKSKNKGVNGMTSDYFDYMDVNVIGS